MESIVPPVLQVRRLTRGRYGQQPHKAVIFPASLPVSKPHHEREMWQTPSVISPRGPCSKTSRLLCMACKARHYPALPTSWILWPSPHPHPTLLPSHTVFLPMLPIPQACYSIGYSGCHSSVTCTPQLQCQALPTPLSSSPPHHSPISLCFFPS